MSGKSSRDQNSANNSPDSFPDLYALLRLAEPQSASAAQIEQAIEQLRRATSVSPESNSPHALRANRIIDLATKYLLDSVRKSAYDAKWRQVYGPREGIQPPSATSNNVAERRSAVSSATSSLVASSTSPAAITAKESDTFFPSGDPDQPFNLTAYKNNSLISSIDSDRELEELLDYLSSSKQDHDAPDRPSLSSSAKSNQVALSTTTAKRISRRRPQRPPWFGLIAVPIGIAIVLAMGSFLLRGQKGVVNNPAPLATNIVPSQVDDDLREPSSTAEVNAKQIPIRGSGLPSPGSGNVAELDFEQALPEPTAPESKMPSVNSAAPPSQSISPPKNNEQPTTKSPPSANKTEKNIPPNSTTTVTSTAAPTPSKSDNTNSSASKNDSAVKLTDQQREAWTRSMLAAKSLIGQQEFEQAGTKLDELDGKAKTQIQREQLARLKAVLVLAREFRESLLAAVANLRAAESIKVGSSTVVSFVSGNANSVTVRISGENKKYNYDEMPIGLAYALVDLKLDRAHSSTLARKAAFAIVHPKSNDLATNAAKVMMVEAVRAGAVASDLARAFDDHFELP